MSDAYQARARRQALRARIIKELGGLCVICGFSDPRALNIDHVNSDGAEHRRGNLSYDRYYGEILSSVQRHEGRFQLLCANCNQIKLYELDERNKKRPKRPVEETGLGS